MCCFLKKKKKWPLSHTVFLMFRHECKLVIHIAVQRTHVWESADFLAQFALWHPGMRSGREQFYPKQIQVKSDIMMIERTPPSPTPVIHFFSRQTFRVFESRNIQRSCRESTMLVSLPPGEKKIIRKMWKVKLPNRNQILPLHLPKAHWAKHYQKTK